MYACAETAPAVWRGGRRVFILLDMGRRVCILLVCEVERERDALADELGRRLLQYYCYINAILLCCWIMCLSRWSGSGRLLFYFCTAFILLDHVCVQVEREREALADELAYVATQRDRLKEEAQQASLPPLLPFLTHTHTRSGTASRRRPSRP